MPKPDVLRTAVIERALEFAWDSWAQLGVSAEARVEDQRAADPEALLVFTFEIARRDPRLFDEVLDWLRENERLVSVQRLRNLSRDDRDRSVVDAALHWVSRFRRNPRFRSERKPPGGDTEPLFVSGAAASTRSDPLFLEHGLVRGLAEPSHKSREPDVSLPINFAFRLRLALGVNSRAEVMRYLLTVRAPDVPAQLVAQVTSYAKQNVAETLEGLVGAGVVNAFRIGNERRYSIDREAWAHVLGLDAEQLPSYREWPELLWAVRQIIRFLDQPELEDRSPYLHASAARDLVESIEPNLLFARVPVLGKSLSGERYWEGFAETVDAALDALRR
jgi:hypothetical protein